MNLDVVLKTLHDNKAKDIITLDVTDKSTIMDTVIVCTATSNRHAKSVAESIIKLAKSQKILPEGVEGLIQGTWVLVNLKAIVVHIMLAEQRNQYQLEAMWSITPNDTTDETIDLQ